MFRLTAYALAVLLMTQTGAMAACETYATFKTNWSPGAEPGVIKCIEEEEE